MNRIRTKLDVEVRARDPKDAAVFEVRYSAHDPMLVADVAREMSDLFIAENLKDRTRKATETAEFLDRELDRLRIEVSTAEERMRVFKEERMGTLPAQLEANLRALDRASLELAANLEAQEAVAQRIALLRRQLESASSGGGGPTGLAAALAEAERKLMVAERVYTDEHPDVGRIRNEVARLREQLKNAPPAGPRPVDLSNPIALGIQREVNEAQVELARRKRQEENLRADLLDLQGRVDATPEREQELQTLTRDYENLVNTYQTLLSKKYEAAIARNLELAQKGERFKVLRPARVPEAPAFPDLRLLLPLGFGLGLIVSTLLVGISEYRNPAFRSVDRLSRAIGLPVVASIPRIDNDRIFEEEPTGEVDPRLVVFTATESAPAEQYRGFAPLFLEDHSRQVVLVTSAARGDGKSLTTMNLALTFACDLNRRVLLIDADLRRPTAHRLVRISRKQGLSNVLQGEKSLQQCAVNSKIPHLTVLPAGPSVRNPLALLTSQRFIDLVTEAKKNYDVVFIDSPPLLPVVDTKLLKKLADMVLFVVRADATPRDAVIRAMRDMKDVAGVVFNEVSPGSFHRYYYYDAYSRYAYGEATDGSEKNDRG
jgi:polysaccharide chain length determinant protein (PEP-CTERM system associated)